MSAFFATFEDVAATSDHYNYPVVRAVPTAEALFHGLPTAVANRVATRAITDYIYPLLGTAGAWLVKTADDNWAKVEHALTGLRVMGEHAVKLIITWCDYFGH